MPHSKDSSDEDFKMPDPVALSHAIMEAYKKAVPIFEDYMRKYGDLDAVAEQFSNIDFDPLNVQESYIEFLEKVAQNPNKFIEIQAGFAQDWVRLWQQSMGKFIGTKQEDPVVIPKKNDRRFKAPEWEENALFDFIKQSYLLTCNHIEKTLENSTDLDEIEKEKLTFQAKLFTDAISPSNFILTNPEVLNETIRTGGENLIKGFQNLLEDLERGGGNLDISTTNYKSFELGKNIAVTKGSIIYQNDLMQLIQYDAKTEKVNKTPLLIIPPWINKYYVLDLREGNSLIEWAVAQGHSVFVISWVNPTAKLAKKNFENYMSEGVLDALSQIEKVTGEKEVNALGYCLGGTLLVMTLAYLAQVKQEERIKSATFLTTLIDFEHAGDMKIFLDDEQLEKLDKMMDKHGIFEGKEMRKTFALMRANDLIWSFVVNNYLMGKEPFPFDLLYWNDDCTNLPAAMHHFYLRNMYRDNKLVKAEGISLKGKPVDISKIKVPCHFISTKEDHIAPWIATYEGAKLLGSKDIIFTLAASGHIAGVINSPSKNKYCYWSNNKMPDKPGDWLSSAKQHDGSWWPAWNKWVSRFSGGKIAARKVVNSIEPAPGSYVKVRSA